uniref:F-box domain-containing protein n=1 Tax=Acrobeloides nanus TaxID=290746 RepID=A0A914EN24_9BILA
MDHTPSEILLELFFFLDRNEIERNQLVCRRWNSTIHKSLLLMPYRKLKGFDIITSPFYSVIAEGEVIFEVGDRESVQRRAESLKYCIIEELKLGNSHDLRTKPIQEIFKSLVTSSGAKLRVLSLRYDCNEKSDFIKEFIMQYISPVTEIHLPSSSLRTNFWKRFRN